MINGGVTIENINDTYIYDDVEIRTRYCYKTKDCYKIRSKNR